MHLRNTLKDYDKVKTMLEGTNSVVFHIRGGDFIRHNITSNVFFYQNAIIKMEQILGEGLEYYVLTDDPVLSH